MANETTKKKVENEESNAPRYIKISVAVGIGVLSLVGAYRRGYTSGKKAKLEEMGALPDNVK